MAQLISQQFNAALCFLLEKEGRGAQSRLAKQQKIDRGYLNGIVKGKKPGSEEVRGKISAYFNITYDEMLLLGRQLLEKKGVSEEKIRPDQTNTNNDAYKTKDESGKLIKNFEAVSHPPVSRNLNLSNLIKKTADILESNTAHRDALSQLIETLHESLCREKESYGQQNQMKEMKQRLENLEKLLPQNKEEYRKSA